MPDFPVLHLLSSETVMVRASLRLFRQIEPLTRPSNPFSTQSPPIYSIGLSYASKDSPPFVSTSEPMPYGFANQRDKHGRISQITSFVDASLSRPAGRGVLNEAAVGGWDDRISLETKKWGAGEDFFCIADQYWNVSVSGGDRADASRRIMLPHREHGFSTWGSRTVLAVGAIGSTLRSSLRRSCTFSLNLRN